MTTVIELGSSFLVWLGGGSVVTIGVSAFVSKLAADTAIEKQKGKLATELERLKGELSKNVETHKLSLRRAEMLFERQVDAAKEFTALMEQLRPAYIPGMDFDEVASCVALGFENVENQLTIFKLRHGVALSDKTRDLVDKCRWAASEGKFDIVGPQQDPSSESVQSAKDLLDNLQRVEKALLQAVRA